MTQESDSGPVWTQEELDRIAERVEELRKVVKVLDPTPPSDSSLPFCEAFWFVDGRRHACLYRKGHVGSCWCCEEYRGGDLSHLEQGVDDVDA